MDREIKIAIAKTVIGFTLFVIIGYFFLSGFGGHPYAKDDLEQVFLDKSREIGILKEEEYEVIAKEYANGISFMLQTESGERACATYTRNLFVDKYREGEFYSGSGVLGLGDFSYRVNDSAMIYELAFHFGDEMEITPQEKSIPIMYYKCLGFCLVAMGFFGGQMWRSKKCSK